MMAAPTTTGETMTKVMILLAFLTAAGFASHAALGADASPCVITLDAVEHGGITITPPLPENKTVPAGTELTLKATPAAGYALDTIYYIGTGNEENEDAISSIILGNSLLTAGRVPVAGEYEIKNAIAMKIMDTFGAGGSFTEYYAMDYKDDVVLMGHDGPGHIAIAEGKIKVRPLKVYHGKVGKGVSIEMMVKNGPVTLLSVVESKGKGMILQVAEGESVPGPILEIGNTNSRYKFPIGARRFVNDWNNHGPAHHCAIGMGHISSKVEKLGSLLGMAVVRVC